MKEKITKEQFLQDVRDEIENIKKYALPEEIKKLNLKRFAPESKNNCIYGQMAENCQSERAIDLILKCCKRVFNKASNVSFTHDDERIILEAINGVPKRKYFDEWDRNFNYLSALEGYILIGNVKEKGRNIIRYIKGKIQTLEL